MLKFVYTLFTGILVVAFIGLGIDAFYASPVMPEYLQTTKFMYGPEDSNPSEAEQAQMEKDQQDYDDAYKAYSKESELYNRNVSIISLIAAIIILSASILFTKKLEIIADGMILGGVLTLTYSIIRGFSAGNDMFRFIMVTIGLVITIYLGYIRFIKPNNNLPLK